jgi:hypothetical protein
LKNSQFVRFPLVLSAIRNTRGICFNGSFQKTKRKFIRIVLKESIKNYGTIGGDLIVE